MDYTNIEYIGDDLQSSRLEVLLYADDCNLTVSHAVDEYVSRIHQDHRPAILLQWLREAQSQNEINATFVRAVWERLNGALKHDGFDQRHRTLLHEAVDYEKFVQPVLEEADRIDRQKAIYREAISNKWTEGWKNRMESATQCRYPANDSFQFLKQLKGLCYTTQSEQHAFGLLDRARRARPVKGRQANIVMAGDVQRARRALLPQETNKKRPLSPSSESTLSPSLSIHPKSTGVSPVLMTQPPSSLDSHPSPSPSSESNSSRYSPSEHSIDIETSSEHSIDIETSSDAQGSGSNHEDCSCAPAGRELVRKVQRLPPQDEREGMVLLCATRNIWSNRKKMCYQHLRITAASSCGLVNNLRREELIHRLRKATAAFNNDAFKEFKRSHVSYFRHEWNRENPGHRLGPAMWDPDPLPSFAFDREKVFTRWSSKRAWEDYQSDGSVNVELAMPITLLPEVKVMIEEEVAMYDWHCRPRVASRAKRGWNRVATYALFNQACRQSLRIYALTAAARVDGNTTLISYPYYIKSTEKGEPTLFRHIDVNVDRFLRGEHCTDLVQNLVTILHDEDDANCTWLVRGFHKNIKAWWQSVRDRGLGGVRCHTTGVEPEMYTKEDETKFGAYQPVPNVAGGARITRPDILHGAVPFATKKRVGVFTWLCGLKNDGTGSLDNVESETLNDISICHRDLIAPRLSPSGRPLAHGRLSDAFAASVKLPSSSAIADAIIGGRSWSDPMVRMERGVLLGDDEKAAHELVEMADERLLLSWRECFDIIRKEERIRFGTRSYFYCKERGLPRPEPLGECGSEEDVACI